jgi:hypothetical protein
MCILLISHAHLPIHSTSHVCYLTSTCPHFILSWALSHSNHSCAHLNLDNVPSYFSHICAPHRAIYWGFLLIIHGRIFAAAALIFALSLFSFFLDWLLFPCVKIMSVGSCACWCGAINPLVAINKEVLCLHRTFLLVSIVLLLLCID